MTFKLYANCKLVKGNTQSTIFDLINGTYTSIPNELFEILNDSDEDALDDQEILSSLYEKLVQLNLGHYVKHGDSFPEMSLDFINTGKLTNAQLEITHSLPYDINGLLVALSKAGCKAVEFRFLDNWTVEELDRFFLSTDDMPFTYFNVLLHNSIVGKKDIDDLIQKHPRIKRVKLFDKEIVSNFHAKPNSKNAPNSSRLNINVSVYSEAQQYNAGLNGKIAIDQHGKVRNYRNHERILGNLCSDEFDTIINQKDFTYLWRISNDEVLKCKDCQFRYVCVDFSDIVHTENGLKRQVDCEFDPYKNIVP